MCVAHNTMRCMGDGFARPGASKTGDRFAKGGGTVGDAFANRRGGLDEHDAGRGRGEAVGVGGDVVDGVGGGGATAPADRAVSLN
jgi:hypothetical protein